MDNQISANKLAEQQLIDLRIRLCELRTAKKWLQDYRIDAPPSVSNPLTAYYNWLIKQEEKTIAMGKRIRQQLSLGD